MSYKKVCGGMSKTDTVCAADLREAFYLSLGLQRARENGGKTFASYPATRAHSSAGILRTTLLDPQDTSRERDCRERSSRQTHVWIGSMCIAADGPPLPFTCHGHREEPLERSCHPSHPEPERGLHLWLSDPVRLPGPILTEHCPSYTIP